MSLCEDDRRLIETLAYVEDGNRFLWEMLLCPCPRRLSSQKMNAKLHETVQVIVAALHDCPSSNIYLLMHEYRFINLSHRIHFLAV